MLYAWTMSAGHQGKAQNARKGHRLHQQAPKCWILSITLSNKEVVLLWKKPSPLPSAMQQLPACPSRGGISSMSCQGHFHITGAGQNLLQRSHCWGLGIVGNARNGVDAPVRHMLLAHVCRVLLGIVVLHPKLPVN